MKSIFLKISPGMKTLLRMSCLVFAVTLILSALQTTASYAAKVDITNMVEWDASRSMYTPKSFTHSYFFDGYTAANERVNGGVFLDFRSTETFDTYFALSTLSDPDARLTRLTMEDIPYLSFPYTIVDYGYKPDAQNSPAIHYNFTASQNGFGNAFIDWQLYADNPITKRSVYPGAIYYNKIDGNGAVDLNEVLARNFGIDGRIKAQGVSDFQLSGEIARSNVTAAPEISPGALNVLVVLLFPGLITLRRAIARKI